MIPNYWQLIRAGAPAEAISYLRDEFERRPDGSRIMTLGIAYLFIGDYLAAFRHFEHVNIAKPHHGASYYGMAGVAQWCLNERCKAVDQWFDGLGCAYADGAGGVTLPLLLYAASVLRPPEFPEIRIEATQLLRARIGDSRIKNWPGPIARFLLREIDEQSLRVYCQGVHEIDTFARHWLADYYVGIAALAAGNRVQYLTNALKCADLTRPAIVSEQWFTAVIWQEEFFLARHETERTEGDAAKGDKGQA